MKIYKVTGHGGQAVSLRSTSPESAISAVRNHEGAESVAFGRGVEITAEEDTAQMEREEAHRDRRTAFEAQSTVLVPTETLLDVLKYLDGVEICGDADASAVMPLIIKIRKCLVGAVPTSPNETHS